MRYGLNDKFALEYMTTPYVINLDKSKDRWKKIQNEWKNSFPVQRVQGIEASPGWVGCGLSHVKAVEEAKARGDPWVLVWEDDCIPRKRNGEAGNVRVIRRLWDQVMKQLAKHPTKWDIVLGATSRVFDTPQKDGDLSSDLIAVYRIKRGFTAHWILYNRSVYDTIIQWKETRPTPIDVYMYEKARVFVTLPFLAEQRPCFSTIENIETNYEQLFDVAERQMKSGVASSSLPIVAPSTPRSITTILPRVSVKLPGL
jgi:hypothetical protein